MDIDYKTLLTEIATFQNAGIISALDILPDPDVILLKRGDDSRILEDIASDEQVTQCVINRKYRVLLNERWAFKTGVVGSASPSAAAVMVHKMFMEDLENTVVYDIFSALLDAPFYGYSALEILWEARGGYYRIKNIIPRPHEWFAFNESGKLIFRGENNAGEVVPSGKFIISRHFPTFKNPYGLRLLSRCIWAVAFKKGGIKIFAHFLEKYGMPWVIANAPSGANHDEKSAMAHDLYSMVQDAVGVIPHGASVQLHSATANQADIFNTYIDRWDKAISKVLMGQTLTADIGDAGSFAASKTHKDVGDDIAKADRLMITSAMNELAWIYTQVNFSGTAAPTFSYIDDEDLTARADLDKKLYDMGVSFNPDYFEQTYGIEKKFFTIKEPQPFMPSFASLLREPFAGSLSQATFPRSEFAAQKCDSATLTVETNKFDSDLREAEIRQRMLDDAAVAAAKQVAEKANIAADDLKKAIETADDLEELEDNLADIGLDYKSVDEIIKNVLTNGAALGFTGGDK